MSAARYARIRCARDCPTCSRARIARTEGTRPAATSPANSCAACALSGSTPGLRAGALRGAVAAPGTRAGLWRTRSDKQIFVSQQDAQTIEAGPGLIFTGLLPDCDHFSGWGGGGVHRLWRDADRQQPNLAAGLLDYLSARLGIRLTALDFAAYLAAVVAHPGYTAKFRKELEEPGIRVPLSTDPSLWHAASALGQQVIWLHTYGTRCPDPAAGWPEGERSIIERYGIKCDLGIGALPARLPDHLDSNPGTGTLRIGKGALSPMAQRVIEYEVGGRRFCGAG